LWIGAFSFLTSALQAQSMGWVTFHRATDLASVVENRDLRIVAVPREDLVLALEHAGPDVLVLDPAWTLEDPGDADVWTYGAQQFPVSRWWQNSLLDAFALEDIHLMSVLTGIDEMTSGVGEAQLAGLPLHWVLSMSLLTDGDAVVSAREDLFVACIGPVDAPLDAPRVRAYVDAELATMTAEDRAKVAGLESPERQGEIGAVREYLMHGWELGGDPPQISLPTEAFAGVVSSLDGVLPRLIDAAAGPGVLQAAKAYTLLAKLVPDPAANGLAPVAERLRAGIAADRLPGDQLWRLAPELLTEPAADVSAPVPAVTTVVSPEGGVLPDDLVAALSTLLTEAVGRPARRVALADALLVAAGLRVVPVRGPGTTLDRDAEVADEMARDAGQSVPLRQAATSWLGAYWALCEAMDPSALETPSWLVDLLSSDAESCRLVVEAVARLLLECQTDVAARILDRSMFLEGNAYSGGVLGQRVTGMRLGMRACVAAAKALDPEARRRIAEDPAVATGRARAANAPRAGTLLEVFLQPDDGVPPEETRASRRRTGGD
jgi:hypothetical protein